MMKFIIGLLALLPYAVISQSDLSPCDSDQDILCTEFAVPMNWHDEKSGTIRLPIKIFKSSNPEPLTPVFWLSGGPGMTNIDYNPPAELLKNHDVIEVGYRGIDGSIRLDCPELVKSFKNEKILSEKAISKNILAAQNCAERLQNSGVDLNGFTVEQVLFDLDSVRQWFGFDKINLLSGSYGTRLALYYSYLFPEHVNRSIMIGANPPGGFVWKPEMIQEKLADYSKICKEDPYCREQTDDLEITFSRVLKNLPKRWLVFPLDRGKIQAVSFGMLYHKNTALQVVDSYLAADRGDYSGLAMMSMAYRYIVPTLAVWGDFISKGMIEYADSINYFSQFNDHDYPLGSPFTQMIMDIGKVWPTEQPGLFDSLSKISAPTLILNGDLDFSSPHERVEQAMMPLLDSGRLVVIPNQGHVGDVLYKQATKNGMSGYYGSGLVQFDYEKTPMNFKVKNGFPKIAKISVGVLSIVMIGAGYGGYRLVRRLRR